MKGKITQISLILVFLFSVVSLVGCDFDDGSRDYLTGKMNEFAIQFNGYELVNINNSYEDEKEYVKEGETEIGGIPVKIEEIIGSQKYLLVYDNKEIEITDKFMKEKNLVYKEVHMIWHNFDESYPEGVSKISQVCVYDEQLFIITCGITARLYGGVKGDYPGMLFNYDLQTGQVLYAGYYSVNYRDTGLTVQKNEIGVDHS